MGIANNAKLVAERCWCWEDEVLVRLADRLKAVAGCYEKQQ